MKIILLNKHGIPSAEIEAHKKIQEAFSKNNASKNWLGFASFKLTRSGRGNGDEDFDLVLITHTNIIVIELKNWHGKELQSSNGNWYVDGNDRGPSPLELVRAKARRLSSLLEQKIGKQATPFIKSYVVIQDGIEYFELPEDDLDSVKTLSEILDWSDPVQYGMEFTRKPRFDLTQHFKTYEEFFLGPNIIPREYAIEGYKPEINPTFNHPQKIYKELRGIAKNDLKKIGLLRQWDFNEHAMDFTKEEDRASVTLKEKKIFEFVSDVNDELILSLLRPVGNREDNGVTIDFTEVFSIPGRVSRLRDFKNSTLPNLNIKERIFLAQTIIKKFADLHELQIAHQDIGENCIWIERDGKLIISNLPTAYFSSEKNKPEIQKIIEINNKNKPSFFFELTPFKKDVYSLGQLIKTIIYEGLSQSSTENCDNNSDKINNFIDRCMSQNPNEIFLNAIEMLEKFNEITKKEQSDFPGMDKFDVYQANSKERDYSEDILFEDGDLLFYKDNSKNFSIKTWHGVYPNPHEVEYSLNLLSFLERARIFKNGNFTSIPKIIDFGLTKRKGLILVCEWVDGKTLKEWVANQTDLKSRLKISIQLILAIKQLHEFDISLNHININEIIITSDEQIKFTNALNYQNNEQQRAHTEFPKNITALQTDCYVIAHIISGLLDEYFDKNYNEVSLVNVKSKLSQINNGSSGISLDPLEIELNNVIKNLSKPKDDDIYINIKDSNIFGLFAADNGSYHVTARASKKIENGLFMTITGLSSQINIEWDLDISSAINVWIQDIQPNQLNRAYSGKLFSLKNQIHVRNSPVNDVDNLGILLMQKPELLGFIKSQNLRKKSVFSENSLITRFKKVDDNKHSENDSSQSLEIDTPTLWKNILSAEEDVLPILIVSEFTRSRIDNEERLLISCHNDNESIDFDRDENVEVEYRNPKDNSWWKIGELNLRESTFGSRVELVVESLRLKSSINSGDKLRLISTLEKYSFNRRSLAIEKILSNRAAVPKLINYFSSKNENLEIIKYPSISESDIQSYSTDKKNINNSQRLAFQKIIGLGPIGLLQGPPGTGKTWFIASLLHHLVTTQKTRRVLLASQSHEGVNNALEKALEIFNEKNIEFNAVRLGNEKDASETIRHLHNVAIENTYREKFQSEKKERLLILAKQMGLSKDFSSLFIDIQLQLLPIAKKIEKNISEILNNKLDDLEVATIKKKNNQLINLFNILRDTNFNFVNAQLESPIKNIAKIEESLINQFEISSPDLIERLRKIIQMSEDWIKALGSPSANFVEFLAKSRTIVAGTLVGLGKKSTGAVDNLYDWVIVDEAGRATSSELAVAMQAGHRILLVGDHKQLPPSYSEEVRGFIKNKYNVDDNSEYFVSDFQRIFNSSYGSEVGTTLLEQYRMAPQIGDLVSECFYDNKLKTSRDKPEYFYKEIEDDLQNEITWVDLSPLGERGLENSSADNSEKWNEVEAQITMNLLKRLIDSDLFQKHLLLDSNENEPIIGIICMYKKQRTILEKMKSQSTWLNAYRGFIKIDTVDSYQGKENKIVIVSTVRNNKKLQSGFLKSSNRINVAMSRSMNKLFIIGASNMWRNQNSDLPLGKILTKIESMELHNPIISAEGFLND